MRNEATKQSSGSVNIAMWLSQKDGSFLPLFEQE